MHLEFDFTFGVVDAAVHVTTVSQGVSLVRARGGWEEGGRV